MGLTRLWLIALAALGVALIVTGVALVWVPAALVIAGACLVGTALLFDPDKKARR